MYTHTHIHTSTTPHQISSLHLLTERYVPLCIDGAEHTDLVQPLAFKFNDVLSEQSNDLPRLETGEAVVTKSTKQTESDKKDGLEHDIEDFLKQIEATDNSIQQMSDSPSDLSTPEIDDKKRAEQVDTSPTFVVYLAHGFQSASFFIVCCFVGVQLDLGC